MNPYTQLHEAYLTACRDLGAAIWKREQGQADWSEVTEATRKRAETFDALKQWERKHADTHRDLAERAGY